jgi:hypothetical protein
MNRKLRVVNSFVLVFGIVQAVFAGDGKWTPQQVLELDPKWLRNEGLQIAPERLWDPRSGTGLLAATVSTGGCSGGFVSPDGLIITNHHCVFSILQEHATPTNDIITNGFVARSRDAELAGKGMRVTVPRKFTDVTKEILAAIPQKATDAQRYKAIEKKGNELLARCESQPRTRCRVAAHDGGVQYVLAESTELTDVRLVYAPPRAIGEFGGEVDNWMWPRHTGDFSIARAYLDGKPFRSEQYFPISRAGVKPGDFVMVLGYPGVTYRSLSVDEMTERRDFYFARRRDVYREWIDILEAATAGNPEGTIAVADWVKTLANRQKNADGQITGLRRGSIVEKQQAADQAVLKWASSRDDQREAIAAYDELRRLQAQAMRTWEHDWLLAQIQMTEASLQPLGPKSLVLAAAIARGAAELAKPEEERIAIFSARNIARVRERLEREQKNLFLPAESRLLNAYVRRALALPKDGRIAAIDTAFAGATTESEIAARISELFAKSRVLDVTERLKMFGETPAQLRARRDPLLDIGLALESEMSALETRDLEAKGAVTRARPAWRRAVAAHAGKPIAPDGNGTLRVSFAHVRGYEPRDGIMYTPQTTLAGLVEKHTGKEPFDVPARVLEAARKNPDLPTDFLSDGDTTSGSSGSPTVNGKGELVGVNFDRVWENVANDFGFNPEVGRNINVDVRYLLWLLEAVENADYVLRELGVRK